MNHSFFFPLPLGLVKLNAIFQYATFHPATNSSFIIRRNFLQLQPFFTPTIQNV